MKGHQGQVGSQKDLSWMRQGQQSIQTANFNDLYSQKGGNNMGSVAARRNENLGTGRMGRGHRATAAPRYDSQGGGGGYMDLRGGYSQR